MRAREAAEVRSVGFPAPWSATVRHRVAEWAPVATPPAGLPAAVRYAAEAPWCARYATRTRRAGKAYLVAVALPAAGLYWVARRTHTAAGAGGAWAPGATDPDGGLVVRWAARRPVPPALADVDTCMRAAGAGPGRRIPVVAATAAAYALAWVIARPGRLFATGLLFGITLIFT